MKFNVSCNLEIRLPNLEVEAASKEDLIQVLNGFNFSDFYNAATTEGTDTRVSDISSEVISKTVEAKINSVDLYIENPDPNAEHIIKRITYTPPADNNVVVVRDVREDELESELMSQAELDFSLEGSPVDIDYTIIKEY